MSFCAIWSKTILCNLNARRRSLPAGSREEEPGFVSLVTILEVVWVLKSLYKRSRQEIANDIEMVLAADTVEVQNEQEVYQAVVALRNGTGSFEDALIGSLGIWRGCSVTLTFDEKAAQRLHGFALA